MKTVFDPKILISLRREKFWTQEDLAAASGVSARTIQRIERGDGGSLETWKALAAAFDVGLERFKKQSSIPLFSQTEKRNAIFGVSVGCLGGLIGCSFGWIGLFQDPNGLRHALFNHTFESTLVIVASAFCLLVPILTWRHLQN